MKRSIFTTALLLTATLAFAQQTKTTIEKKPVEMVTLGEALTTPNKVVVEDENDKIVPVYDKNKPGRGLPIQLGNPDLVAQLDASLEVFPNPSTGVFRVRFGDDIQFVTEIDLLVLDITGKVVYHDKRNLIDAPQNLEIDLTEMNTGIYFLVTEMAGERLTRRLVKTD